VTPEAEKEVVRALLDEQEVLRRLSDYSRSDPRKLVAELVAKWREAHPDAAAETSAAFKPLIRLTAWRKSGPDDPDEIWHNETYNVTVRRHAKDPVFGTWEGMVQIGISSFDGTARHDWRDFQAIKNQIAGGECEAFELYPAESRLLDPPNYYTLWCFPGVKRLKIGQTARLVRDADSAWAPQRELPPGGSDQ
jgi:hypothetical protein